jgi:hypothetical protein
MSLRSKLVVALLLAAYYVWLTALCALGMGWQP